MDPELLRDELRALARQGRLPRAVIAVDLYGQCADYDPIVQVCAEYEVPLIEDAAEALGALGDPSAIPALEKVALEGGSGASALEYFRTLFPAGVRISIVTAPCAAAFRW